MEWFLEGNRRFREEVFSQQRHLFQPLAGGQRPAALWIGCSDSRVPANLVIDAPAGHLFVHRNVGNIVAPGDPNLAAVLEVAVEHLRVEEIILCGHSECGAMQALTAGVADGPDHKPIPHWLRHARPALDRVGNIPGLDSQQQLVHLVRENVRLQLRNLVRFPCVEQAIAAGRLRLHGVLYHLDSGELELLGDASH